MDGAKAPLRGDERVLMGLALERQHGWSLGEPAMKRKKPFPAQIIRTPSGEKMVILIAPACL